MKKETSPKISADDKLNAMSCYDVTKQSSDRVWSVLSGAWAHGKPSSCSLPWVDMLCRQYRGTQGDDQSGQRTRACPWVISTRPFHTIVQSSAGYERPRGREVKPAAVGRSQNLLTVRARGWRGAGKARVASRRATEGRGVSDPQRKATLRDRRGV